MKLFRSGPSPHQTALAMIGAKPGSTVIVIGVGDPALAAEVALVTGLNGRTLVIVPSADAQPRVETAAASAGALVDVETSDPTSLPAADSVFDIAVVTDLAPATPNGDQIVREAARVVRAGGRVVMIEGKRVGGLRKLLPASQPETNTPTDELVRLLSGAGLRGTRLLGSAEGISYYEGTK